MIILLIEYKEVRNEAVFIFNKEQQIKKPIKEFDEKNILEPDIDDSEFSDAFLDTEETEQQHLVWQYYMSLEHELLTSFSFVAKLFNKRLIRFSNDVFEKKPQFVIQASDFMDKYIDIPNWSDRSNELEDEKFYKDFPSARNTKLVSSYFTILVVPSDIAEFDENTGYNKFDVSGNIMEQTFIMKNLTPDQLLPYIADKIFEVEELLK